MSSPVVWLRFTREVVARGGAAAVSTLLLIMEQPEDERSDRRAGRPPIRLPHPTRSFSRSRSRSPSGRDDDDGANGHALRGPAGEGRDSGDELSPVLETAPRDLREAAVVDLAGSLEKLSCPVFTFDRAGSGVNVTHPGYGELARHHVRVVRVFDEKIQYVDRKLMGTLGELLWEFFQLLTSRPFYPKYYSAEPIAADTTLGWRLRGLRDARKADGEVEAFFDREAI